jgi:hypothetical protein
MLGFRPGMYSVWGGNRCWVNKFGIKANQPFGNNTATVESTWLVGATMAF